MATKRQVLACRQNGRLGGPKTAAGKAVSRLNARKHGIFASALTVEDAEELKGLHEELVGCLAPVGAVEEMLVEKLAQTYLRMQRCARAEAEWHVKTWEVKADPVSVRLHQKRCDDGRHASWFDVGWFERGVQLFGRYDQTLTNQFIKLVHEIERVQRLRGGEPPSPSGLRSPGDVAPPIAAEVNVEVEGASCGTAPQTRGCVKPGEGPTEQTSTAGGGCATQACETNQIDPKPLEDKGIEEPPAEAGPPGPSVRPAAASGQATGTTGRAGARPSRRAGSPLAKRTKRVASGALPMSYRRGRRAQVFFQKKVAQRECARVGQAHVRNGQVPTAPCPGTAGRDASE